MSAGRCPRTVRRRRLPRAIAFSALIGRNRADGDQPSCAGHLREFGQQVALNIIGKDVDHASPIEQFTLEQVSHISPGRHPDGDRSMSRALPAFRCRQLIVRFNSTPARTDLREESIPDNSLGDHSGADGQIRNWINGDECACFEFFWLSKRSAMVSIRHTPISFICPDDRLIFDRLLILTR